MSPNQHPIDASTLPAGTSGTFTIKCSCGATRHFIDSVEQPHDHTRERIEVSVAALDLTALRIDVVTASNFDIDSSSHPWTLVDPGHLIEAIDRAEAAEAKVAAVESLHPREVIAVHEGHGEEAMCPRCQTHWPCKTIRTLDATP